MHDDVIDVLKMFPEHAKEFWENLHLTYNLREELEPNFRRSESSDYSSECENSETTSYDCTFFKLKDVPDVLFNYH